MQAAKQDCRALYWRKKQVSSTPVFGLVIHESCAKYIAQYKSRRICDMILTSFFLALQPINLIVCNFGGLQKKNGALPSNVCRISVQPPGHSPVDKVTPSGMQQGVWRRGNVCEPPKRDRECKRLKDGDWVIKWHELRNAVHKKFRNEKEICTTYSFKLHPWHSPSKQHHTSWALPMSWDDLYENTIIYSSPHAQFPQWNSGFVTVCLA